MGSDSLWVNPSGQWAHFHLGAMPGRRTPKGSEHLVQSYCPFLARPPTFSCCALDVVMEMNTPDEADEKEICLTFTKTVFHSQKKKCFKLRRASSLNTIMKKPNYPSLINFLPAGTAHSLRSTVLVKAFDFRCFNGKSNCDCIRF